MSSNEGGTCDNFVTNLLESVEKVVCLGAELNSPVTLVSEVRGGAGLKLKKCPEFRITIPNVSLPPGCLGRAHKVSGAGSLILITGLTFSVISLTSLEGRPSTTQLLLM